MNYHELITAVQQYLTSGFQVSRDHGRGFLKSLDGAIRDRAEADRGADGSQSKTRRTGEDAGTLLAGLNDRNKLKNGSLWYFFK
jgi:hypothetical protein